MHVYFISEEEKKKKWEQSQHESVVYPIKAWTVFFPFLLHILTAFVSSFGLNSKRAYVCSFNWFQAKSIFPEPTYMHRECLQKMMSLVFIVVRLPVHILIYFIAFWSDARLIDSCPWEKDEMNLKRCDINKMQAEYVCQPFNKIQKKKKKWETACTFQSEAKRTTVKPLNIFFKLNWEYVKMNLFSMLILNRYRIYLFRIWLKYCFSH